MNVLYALESVRTPFFDSFFSVLTYLGSESVVLVFLLVTMWCLDKKLGRFILYASMFSLGLNILLKNVFCVPRPWTIDPDFTIVESARAGATGYSFPSGHTANAVTVYGSWFVYRNKTPLRFFAAFAIIATVAFSRLYLGVHTPQDVFFSLSIGVVILVAMYFAYKSVEVSRVARAVLDASVILFGFGILVYMLMRGDRPDTDPLLEAEGLKNAYSALGAVIAVVLSLRIDDRYTKYRTDGVWWAQMLKIVLGAAVVFAAKELLKAPLGAVFGVNPVSHAVRYFIMVFAGACLWPMTFGFWSSLGKNKALKVEGDALEE